MKVVAFGDRALQLLKPVKGNGGFQSLMREMQARMQVRVEMDLPPEIVSRLDRYSLNYGRGGFQDRLCRLLGWRVL